jgi:LuxR family maltose regulon positive regulatory protein
MSFNQLLSSKLYAQLPRLDTGIVARPQLIQRLNQGLALGRQFTFVSAPPGYGKTTLIGDWLRRTKQPAAWLSLDEGDNDPVRFVTYLIAALQRIDGEIGRTAQSLLGAPQLPPAAALMTTLVNDIAHFAIMGQDVPPDLTSFVLVLDDYHAIHSEWVHAAADFLLTYPPPPMHLVLITRADPPLPIPRLRARGQLTELREQDLRFSADEAAVFLNQAMKLGLADEAITSLETRTEGWIAGLQLAALSMQGRDAEHRAAFVAAFSGKHRHVMDYLVSEVLGQQSAEVRDFMCQTAILDYLTAPLCDAVTGRSDSQAILTHLERANLFLIPLDDRRELYRYHHLLADFLRTELPMQTQAALHHKAAGWFEARGLAAEAIKHGLAAGDADEAARLIEQSAGEALQRGEIATLLSWLEALPDDVVRASVDLSTVKGWALHLTGQAQAARSYAHSAETHLDADTCPASRGRLLSLRCHLAISHDDDAQAAIPLAMEALDLLGETDEIYREATLVGLAVAQERSGDCSGAIQSLYEVASMGQRLGHRLTRLGALTDLVRLLGRQGKRREALELCPEAIDSCQDEQGNPLTDMLYISLGSLEYQTNNLAQAREYLIKGLEICRQLGVMELSMWGVRALALAHQAMGEPDAALATIRDARRYASLTSDTRAMELCAATEAELELKQGNLTAVEREMAALDLAPTTPPSAEHEQALLTYVRLRLAQKRAREILPTLAALERWAQADARYGDLITIHILQALAQHSLGREEQALAYLEESVCQAEAEEYRRAFLDEGPTAVDLLARLHTITPAFIGSLLEAVPATSSETVETNRLPSSSGAIQPELVEALSERELEILRLIAAGLSNQEIGERLTVTLRTVKWHIHNIYGKLGVHSRTQAISRAGESDLLRPRQQRPSP